MKNILIVGGLGFIGGRIAEYLSQKGYNVRISTRKPKKEWPSHLPLNTSLIQLDYNSEEQKNNAMNGIESVIHLAGPDAHTQITSPNQLINDHVDLTKKLLRSAINNSIKKFIYFSTIHVYGENLKGVVTEETKPLPIHPFAIAHLKAEEIIQSDDSNMETMVLRCSNTFGVPYFENIKCWNLVMNDLCKSAIDNRRLILNSSGQQYRDFISMDNILDATFHLLKLPSGKLMNSLFNLGSSKSIRIIEMAEKIKIILQNNFKVNCPIENKNQSSEKMNSLFSFSIDKVQKVGWDFKNNEKEIVFLIKYCQGNQNIIENTNCDLDIK